MSTNPPSRSYRVASGRFWRNVTLIALAHVALVAGLIRWSLAARSAPEAQTLVWLSGTEDLTAERSETSAAPPAKISAPPSEPEGLKPDEMDKEQSLLAQAKSEIELPTPKPTPVATPKAFGTPKTKAPPKPTPKSTPKPAPKKILLAKATKSSAKEKLDDPHGENWFNGQGRRP